MTNNKFEIEYSRLREQDLIRLLSSRPHTKRRRDVMSSDRTEYYERKQRINPYAINQPLTRPVPIDNRESAIILWDFENVSIKKDGSDFKEYYNFLCSNFKIDDIQMFDSRYRIGEGLKKILTLMHIKSINIQSKKKQAVDAYIINEMWSIASVASKPGAVPKTIIVIALDSDYIATVRSIKQHLNPKQKIIAICKQNYMFPQYYDIVFDQTLKFPMFGPNHTISLNPTPNRVEHTDVGVIVCKIIFGAIKKRGSIRLSKLGIDLIRTCHTQGISESRYREIISPSLKEFINKNPFLMIYGKDGLMTVTTRKN